MGASCASGASRSGLGKRRQGRRGRRAVARRRQRWRRGRIHGLRRTAAAPAAHRWDAPPPRSDPTMTPPAAARWIATPAALLPGCRLPDAVARRRRRSQLIRQRRRAAGHLRRRRSGPRARGADHRRRRRAGAAVQAVEPLPGLDQRGIDPQGQRELQRGGLRLADFHHQRSPDRNGPTPRHAPCTDARRPPADGPIASARWRCCCDTSRPWAATESPPAWP